MSAAELSKLLEFDRSTTTSAAVRARGEAFAGERVDVRQCRRDGIMAAIAQLRDELRAEQPLGLRADVGTACEGTTHFGWNVGLGMKLYALGFRSFVEARYHRTSANGSSVNYFPVTLGLLF